jgi:hypothetical protein
MNRRNVTTVRKLASVARDQKEQPEQRIVAVKALAGFTGMLPLKPLISKRLERQMRASVRRDIAHMRAVFKRVK